MESQKPMAPKPAAATATAKVKKEEKIRIYIHIHTSQGSQLCLDNKGAKLIVLCSVL